MYYYTVPTIILNTTYWYSDVNHKLLINGLYIGLLMLVDIIRDYICFCCCFTCSTVQCSPMQCFLIFYSLTKETVSCLLFIERAAKLFYCFYSLMLDVRCEVRWVGTSGIRQSTHITSSHTSSTLSASFSYKQICIRAEYTVSQSVSTQISLRQDLFLINEGLFSSVKLRNNDNNNVLIEILEW